MRFTPVFVIASAKFPAAQRRSAGATRGLA